MKTAKRNGLTALPRPGDPGYRQRRAIVAVERALRDGKEKAVREYFKGFAPADIGDVLRKIDESLLGKALEQVDPNHRQEAFVFLPMSLQLKHVRTLNRQKSVELFNGMPPDERADLFMRLTEEEQLKMLPALAQAEREDIRRLISHKEGTAGAVMTSEYAALRADQRVDDALLELRRIAPDRETIYTAYVVDEERRLIGVCSLRDLILAEPQSYVRDVMESRVVQAKTTDSHRSVAKKIAKYDLIALPVVDAEDRIVGIVTADDAMDVAAEEATTTMQRAGAVEGFTSSLLDASIGFLYRKRVFWLVILVFGNIFSGAGIALFEDIIAANVVLVFFLPLLIDSGGNAGSQSTTLVIRALGTGDVDITDWGKLLVREFSVAFLLGLSMALAVSMLGYWRGGANIALVVSTTMVAVVIIGSLVGTLLPFLFTKLKMDPASASGPLITSIIDGCGVLIYFGIARIILGI